MFLVIKIGQKFLPIFCTISGTTLQKFLPRFWVISSGIKTWFLCQTDQFNMAITAMPTMAYKCDSHIWMLIFCPSSNVLYWMFCLQVLALLL